MTETIDQNKIEVSTEGGNSGMIQTTPLVVTSADLEVIKYKILDDLKKEFKTDKSTLMSIFGVFASIITFLSVEVQILQKATTFNQLIFLSLVLFMCLLSFIFLLEWLIKNWIDQDIKRAPYLIYILMVVLILLEVQTLNRITTIIYTI